MRLFRPRPIRRLVLATLSLGVLLPVRASAQEAEQLQQASPAQPLTLTLEEAIRLARRNNPDYLAQRNDEVEADWAVREAYGGLLPGAAAGLSLQYQAKGTSRFGVFTGADFGLAETPAYYLSDYYLGLNYQLSGAKLYAPARERANRRATQARIDAADFTLVADVTRQYLAVLRARDGVELARQELARADENLKLAQARVAVGSAIPLEATQAEVERGRAEVALLQAENEFRTALLRLSQSLGVQLPENVELTSTFEVFDLPWSQEELLEQALAAHPQLNALRAAEDASGAAVRAARMAYLPTLEFSAGWSGYTREAGSRDYISQQIRNQAQQQQSNCEFINTVITRLTDPLPAQDCSVYARQAAEAEAEALRQNDAFPFRFTRQPLTAQLRISLPIFQGFSRERQLEAARVAAEDARLRVRAEELRIRAELATAYQNLVTARRSVELETRNRALADDQLRLARERYRVGAASFLELSEAETLKARADRAYLAAVYAFHEALAALEVAAGRSLRVAGASQ